MKTVKNIAGLIVGLLLSVRPVHAQMLPAGDATQETEANVPGIPILARWDMLLDSTGADAFKKVATTVPSDSQVYQAYTGNAVEIRQAMADASTNGGVIAAGQNMSISQTYNNGQTTEMPQPVQYNYFPRSRASAQSAVRLNGFFQNMGSSPQRAVGDHLTVRFDIGNVQNLQIGDNNRMSPLNVKPTMNYSADMAPGDAVAFLAQFNMTSNQAVYQLTVYESFKIREELSNTQINRDSDWWIANGPSKFRKMLGVIAIWEAGAAHDSQTVPPGFSKTFDDGQRVRLVAISKPNQYPGCWWDGGGKPISFRGGFGAPQSSVPDLTQAIIEFRGPENDMRGSGPATRPMTLPGNNQVFYSTNQTQIIQVNDQQPIEVHVAVGEWKEIGQCAVGSSVDIDGINYKILEPRMVGRRAGGAGVPQIPVFTLSYQTTGNPTDFIAISPVGPDGMEAVSNGGPGRMMEVVRQGQPQNLGFAASYRGFSIDDVKYVRICARTKQSVTFDHYATSPMNPPKMDFTNDELDLALAKKKQVEQTWQAASQEENILRQQNFRTQFDMVQADQSTASGTLRMLIDSAAGGDEKSVVDILTSGADTSVGATALAHYCTTAQHNLWRIEQKFGQAKLAALRMEGVNLPDIAGSFSQINWQKNDDGTWSGGSDMTLRKDGTGHFHLEFAPLKNGDVVAQIRKSSVSLDKIAKALDQPDVTMDQIRAAAKE